MSQTVDPQHLKRLARTSRFATLVVGVGLAVRGATGHCAVKAVAAGGGRDLTG